MKSRIERTERFIKKAKIIHKDENYNYSKVYNTYEDSKHKDENLNLFTNNISWVHKDVFVIDHTIDKDGIEYGGFWVEANSHLRGSGNRRRAIDKNAEAQKSNKQELIEKYNLKFPNNHLDFSLVEYVDSKTDINVICTKIGGNGKIHGVFPITPDNLLAGKGCPICGNSISKCEDEIYDFLCELIPKEEISKRNRNVLNGNEIGIYIPKHKLGINE